MAYINIDLDEFDSDEIIDEIIRRLKVKPGDSFEISDKERKKLIAALSIKKPLFEYDGIDYKGPKIETLEDQFKVDHFLKIFNKYTSAELEKLIP